MKQCAVWFLALFAFACVESQPPVDRTQPNLTRKSDLVGGEWYFLQTVVDTPYTASFTFAGESGELERIVWDVERDYLVARRSFENVAGADPEGINGSDEAAGAPVAMYAIESHFDVRRQYNPVTGEELNVIEENTTDRPWQDREFMRVDWSQNLIQSPDFLMIQRYFDGVRASPVAWHVEDETDVNAPVFERESESGPLVYMDVTNKMFVEPTEVELPGFGPIPSCLLMQFQNGYPDDCAPAEVTVRNSFRRVDPNDDYQPLVYSGDRMDRFGYFVTERAGYDPSYGLVEPLRYRFANRHDLWQESHRTNESGEIVACTEDAQCDDSRGSVCDLDWGRARRLVDDGRIQGACTIAYRDRETRPIVYHATPNYPESLVPELDAIETNWNRAFVETVGALRESECASHGGTDCASERTRADSMFVVCRTPVAAGDRPECGEEGTIARIGDLRHSLIGYVNEPHRSSPLGYGPSAADPLTGEIVVGTAFIYGAGVETYASMGRDIVRLLNGHLTEADLASGAPVRAYAERLRGAESATAHEADAHAIPVDGSDVERIAAAMDFSWAPRSGRGAAASPAEAMDRMDQARGRLLDSQSGLDGQDQLARLVGTDLELLLTGREERMAASIDPDLPVDDAVLDRASPLRGARPDRIEALERARIRLQEGAGLDYGDFADEGLLGLARAIQRAAIDGSTIEWNGVSYAIETEDGFIDYDAVREMLRHPIMAGLALHEVGHTLGLRHNFSGSYDSPNYGPEYWALRDDGHMHPRPWDPMTDAEIDGRIGEHAYSTVMDYGQNFVVSDANGIGHYDYAAIKMGYGDLVEVFTDVPDTREVAWLSFIQSAGWPASITIEAATGGPLSAYTYTEWPSLVGGRANLEARADVPYTSLVVEPFLERSGIDYRTVDAEGRVAVPYRFCSDEQADLSPGCYRYDAGADPYESVQSVADSYWNGYIFNNFRRYRIGFNVDDTASRIMDRYFRKLQRANQSYALYRGLFTDVFDADESFFTAERGMGSYTLAAGTSYQLFTRVIAAPEPGTYGTGQRGDGSPAFLPGGSAVAVDEFDGRFLETTWDFDAGYFWFDQVARVGYFYDKILALQALTDPTTYFVGRDTDSDIRRYQLNFASTFGPSMTRFVGGLVGDDWSVVAPRVNAGVIDYPDPLQIANDDMPGTPLAPNAGFSVQLYAAVYGMSLIPQTYDQEFLHRSRIWVQGGAEEIDIDPSVPTVRFTEAESGLTYVAVSYPDASGDERGTGAQMLLHAQALADRAATDSAAAAELDSFIDNLDVVRRLTWQLGFGAQP